MRKTKCRKRNQESSFLKKIHIIIYKHKMRKGPNSTNILTHKNSSSKIGVVFFLKKYMPS